eukprot:CAMPEP_0198247090 /NCGR_PEP_ID=MMETSP1446-20131203/46300_1 /TAXON_ID=1461542 ORGANISM="Unidentified sp, Strain CCMP2111" /NCGR_SAMPLE_ID=MMETSP1446 /ASSEMBLY_ACC=CAM_ASM_001112 /LENGTH=470 /DNA_ID=CAMNT_0043931415 /DNA_START=190 /DNA_END=1602 /DNA_ORIENTATION=+
MAEERERGGRASSLRRRHASTTGKKEIESHAMKDDGLYSSVESEPGSDKMRSDKKGQFSSMFIRTISGFVFVSFFGAIIYLGHIYCLALLILLQGLITRELFDLARATSRTPMDVAQENKELPGFRPQQWYIFGVACFYMYGRLLRDILVQEITNSNVQTGPLLYVKSALWFILQRHSLVTYFLYLFGFVMSVLSLKKGKYMYQFGQYAWTITIILFALVQTSFLVSNIFDGLIWFVLPCALVIINDVTAYFFGKLFGRTPLIKLSPKKTMEGFIGAGMATVLISFPLTAYLSQFEWCTCSRTSFAKHRLECRTPELYVPTNFRPDDWIPARISSILSQFELWPIDSETTFMVKPIMFHGAILAVFASLIAPFGGFFASGVKRALKIKDFGHSIPGHGGLTDRMDCQIVMGLFSYVYLNNFVKIHRENATQILDKVLLLDPEEQLLLFTRIGYLIAGQGLIPPNLTQHRS